MTLRGGNPDSFILPYNLNLNQFQPPGRLFHSPRQFDVSLVSAGRAHHYASRGLKQTLGTAAIPEDDLKGVSGRR